MMYVCNLHIYRYVGMHVCVYVWHRLYMNVSVHVCFSVCLALSLTSNLPRLTRVKVIFLHNSSQWRATVGVFEWSRGLYFRRYVWPNPMTCISHPWVVPSGVSVSDALTIYTGLQRRHNRLVRLVCACAIHRVWMHASGMDWSIRLMSTANQTINQWRLLPWASFEAIPFPEYSDFGWWNALRDSLIIRRDPGRTGGGSDTALVLSISRLYFRWRGPKSIK